MFLKMFLKNTTNQNRQIDSLIHIRKCNKSMYIERTFFSSQCSMNIENRESTEGYCGWLNIRGYQFSWVSWRGLSTNSSTHKIAKGKYNGHGF